MAEPGSAEEGQADQPAAAPDPARPELMAMGEGPGGSWYCEPQGLAQGEIYDHDLDGVRRNATPNELLARALWDFPVFLARKEPFGEADLRFRAGDQASVELEAPWDLGRDDVLATVPEAASRELTLAVTIEDPLRTDRPAAGVARFTFRPAEGWVLNQYNICLSALTGRYQLSVPLSEEERRRLDPVEEDAS